MASLLTATCIAYSERQKRGFFHQLFVSLVFTGGAILGFFAMLLVGVVLPAFLGRFGRGEAATYIIELLRWVLLWLVAAGELAIIYRYAPVRARAQWRWVTWGSVFASAVWLVGSLLLALYVRTFGTYGKTYGALGAVIVLLLWFYLSSFSVLLGAEINSEMERQTRRDTTDGPEKPQGKRGVFAADTVGPSADAQTHHRRG